MDGDAAMISRDAHAALDGVSAAALMLGPTALGWPRDERARLRPSVQAWPPTAC
jgi:hypothetical protein